MKANKLLELINQRLTDDNYNPLAPEELLIILGIMGARVEIDVSENDLRLLAVQNRHDYIISKMKEGV